MNKKMVSASKELNGGEKRTVEQNSIILIHSESETVETHAGRPEGRRAAATVCSVCPQVCGKEGGGLWKARRELPTRNCD